MIVYLLMVMDEYGENRIQSIHLKSSCSLLIQEIFRSYLFVFSRDLAIAIHNEEERLYQEAQQEQSQGTTKQVPRSPSKQSKKSKNKSRRSSHDDEEKESCHLL